MRLRNKKNGWIVDFSKGNFISSKDYGLVVYIDDHRGIRYNSLAELNEEWEDYEEPRAYWYIDDAGVIQIDQILSSEINMRKSIGNYFETKKEAEKAVEKLKAWKRLNDKGVVIHSCEGAESCENFYRIIFSVRCDRYWSDRSHSVDSDLNLLFGGGE